MMVDALAREKNVPKEIVFGALEQALASATKKLFRSRKTSTSASPSTAKAASTRPSAAGWSFPTKPACRNRTRRSSCPTRASTIPTSRSTTTSRSSCRSDRVRPPLRAGHQAGDPAEDPRRRTRTGAQRFPRARRPDRQRHGQAHGQGRCRSSKSARSRRACRAIRHDPEGEPAHRRSRARLRREDRPPGTRAAGRSCRARRPSSS